MSQDVKYLFYLSILLIAAAYFVGVATDANSLANGLVKLLYAGTGRTSTGQFAGYPGGATTVQGG